jgi:hypothetical protein
MYAILSDYLALMWESNLLSISIISYSVHCATVDTFIKRTNRRRTRSTLNRRKRKIINTHRDCLSFVEHTFVTSASQKLIAAAARLTDPYSIIVLPNRQICEQKIICNDLNARAPTSNRSRRLRPLRTAVTSALRGPNRGPTRA